MLRKNFISVCKNFILVRKILILISNIFIWAHKNLILVRKNFIVIRKNLILVRKSNIVVISMEQGFSLCLPSKAGGHLQDDSHSVTVIIAVTSGLFVKLFNCLFNHLFVNVLIENIFLLYLFVCLTCNAMTSSVCLCVCFL